MAPGNACKQSQFKRKIMKRCFASFVCLALTIGLVSVCRAHFGVIQPEKSMLMQGDNPNLELTLAFCHTFEQNGMNMARPKNFGVL